MRFRVLLSLLVIFSCAGVDTVPSTNTPLPDAATLKARVDALAAAAPPNYRETIVSHGTGPDESRTVYHRFDDSRTVSGRKPLQQQSGVYEHERWLHDENGITVVDDDPPDEAHAITVTAAATPNAYVIASLTKAGFGTKTTVDATTLRIQKLEEIDSISTTTTTYDSYGTFGGYTMPATWTTTTTTGAGKPSTTSYERRDVVLGSVTADDIAQPSTDDIITFPPGAARVTLPATFANESSVVLLHGNIGTQNALFELDSGSQVITISPGLAHRIGAQVIETGSLSGSGSVSVKEVLIPILQIGPLTMHNVVASVVPIGSFGFNNEEFGLIGFDFLATLALTVDYLHQQVTAESGWDFHQPLDSSTFPLPVLLGNRVPMTTATINGARSDRLVVDSGGATTLMLFHYFSRQHPEIFDQATFSDRIFSGVGGEFGSDAFYFKKIKLGHLALENFTGYRTSADSSAFNWHADGLFGSDFLRHFTVTFDFVHANIYLRQNHDGGLLPAGH